MSLPTLTALVHTIRVEACRIVSVDLRPATAEVSFPTFEAGSHIDVHLEAGLRRSYSLCNDPAERQRYVIAVLNDRASRGGSRFIHEKLRPGSTIPISPPKNNFRLEENARETVLIAGGIGVTPVLAMLHRLRTIGRHPHVFYCVRSRPEAAFLPELDDLTGGAVHLHVDDERGGPPDLRALLAGFNAQAHFYCCGPAPMLAAYESACTALGYPNVHLERFTVPAAQADTGPEDGFELELARTPRTIWVPPGTSVLRALLDAGFEPDYSCEAGVCGTCETRVLSGDVDHRDVILTEAERASNTKMMICVSRCRSKKLVLDL